MADDGQPPAIPAKTQKSFLMKMLAHFTVTKFCFLLTAVYFITVGKNAYNLFNPNTAIDTDARTITPRWEAGGKFDVSVYVSPSAELRWSKKWARKHLVFEEKGVAVAEPQDWQVNISTSKIVNDDNNGTLFAHIYFQNSNGPERDGRPLYSRAELTVFRQFQENATRNLLASADDDARIAGSGEAVADGEDAPASPAGLHGTKRTVAFFKTRMPLRIMDNYLTFPVDKIPADLMNLMNINGETMQWGPVAFADLAWLQSKDFVVINTTTTNLPLMISYSPVSLGFLRMMMQMSNSLDLIGKLTNDEAEKDQVKEMFADTDPRLLAVTIVVSVFHILFDFLAFKSDISFWRERDTFEGLSARSLLMNLVCQAVIFLYLMDNDSSMLILISNGAGLLIEVWKLTRIYRVRLERSKAIPFLPVIRFGQTSSKEASTQELDAQALNYLMIIMLPIVIGYAVYSLLYASHKSWYSWVLESFASAMYVGGFVLMTPQLFINYKLKSVAHLPWRVFVYKALNTFIDDLFAFIITMPTMHRLSVFRDDLVFFIYLYQRWVYPVDASRVESMGDAPAEVEQKGSDKPKQD